MPETSQAKRVRFWRSGLPVASPTYGSRLAIIVAAGALLRLALLARQPLGVDEDFTAAIVVRPLGDMLAVVSRDSAPPLFYVLEWLVAQIDHGPAALRLVPAIAGILLIPLLAALARRVAGGAAGLWAAAFAAALPATVLASDNARMYSVAGTLVVAAILLMWRTVEPAAVERGGGEPAASGRRNPWPWVAYVVVVAAAVWTDYFAAVAIAGVLVAVVWLRPGCRVVGTAAAATAIGFASIGPWLLFARSQFDHAGSSFWIPPLSPASVAGTFGQLFAGPPVDPGVPGREILLALQVVAVIAGSVALAFVAFSPARDPAARRARASEPGAEPRATARAGEPRAAIFLLVACSGVVALAAVSLWRPLLEARYAGVMWLPLFALAGVGLAAAPRKIAVALLVAVAVPSLALGAAVTHPETASLLPEIESPVGPHDLVAADPNHYFAVLAQAGPRTLDRLHVLAATDPPWYFGTAAYPPDALIHSVPADVTTARGTIFYVADPGAAPPSLPPGYGETKQRCVIAACLTIWEPGG